MELSLICPLAHLDMSYLLPGRFCIAPIAAANEDYFAFFQNAAGKGYKVILDNGVFEAITIEDDRLIAMAKDMGATTLIAPDTIGANAAANYVKAVAFCSKARNLYYNGQLMFVVQCPVNHDTEFWKVLDLALTEPFFDVIGICRDAVYNAFGRFTRTYEQELNRFYFAAELQKRYSPEQIRKKKWHFLGLGEAIMLIQYYWFVDTMDTASLFWQGVQEKYIQRGILPTRLKRPHDYFTRPCEMTYDKKQLIEHNCAEAQVYAQRADQLRQQIVGGRI